MRAKNFSTGLQGVLFEERHYARMGQAVWLYGWLVLRQTRQIGTMGLVLGGRPVSYREIEEETGFNPRTLERWMRILRREGYVETKCTPAGLIIQVTKAKKFPQRSADIHSQARKSAGSGTQPCGQSPQSCGALQSQATENAALPGGIDSRCIENKIPNPFQQTSPVERENPNTEAQRTVRAVPGWRRAEIYSITGNWRDRKEAREELLRRELAVGQGPVLSGR